MATPGTPSGVNHSSDSQKCGVNAASPRPSSSFCKSVIRSARTLFSTATPSCPTRKSSSFSSGQSAHSSGGTTRSFGTPQSIISLTHPQSGVSMRAVSRSACALAIVFALAPAVRAQQPAGQPKDPKAAAAKPDQKPEQKPEEPQKYEETVVVSASKNEEKLINAPATMTVIGSQTIQSAPTQNFAELLRAVPGMNITQVSARDINVTMRSATGTLATGQLALLDGRSLYQDFFGFVMWDFLPVNLNEIKQIEVIRGPASATWGANALNGVVNVITKSPREMQGTSAVLGVGGFDRNTGDAASSQSAGTLFYISGTHAQAVND